MQVSKSPTNSQYNYLKTRQQLLKFINQMEFRRTNVSFFTYLFIFTILFASCSKQFGAASRPLIEKKYFENIINQSLQKGPVPPIGGSPCTHIPGGSGHCHRLNGMHFAGRVARAPPPPPFPAGRTVIDFSVSSQKSENNKQDASS